MLNFLILGTTECKYCHEAKKLLNQHNLKFIYVDLTLKFGEQWRSIFDVLKDKLGSQRTIPIIAVSSSTIELDYTPIISPSLFDSDVSWQLVGNYFDLEEYLDSLPITLDDNY